MGMHFGLIAAKVPLSEFRAAFLETWPEREVASSADGFGNADEIWSWMSANERFVSARNWTKEDPGSEVYVFCQDGPWAVLMDFSYVLASDEAALQQLSTRFGSVLSFIVETTGGCAYFWSYEAGQLRRSIQNINGELTSSGARLPQEEDIDVERYYMEETERLMQAFGLSMPEDLPVASTAVAIATIDRTDYTQHAGTVGLSMPEDLSVSSTAVAITTLDRTDYTQQEGTVSDQKSSTQASSSRMAKPWWKFW